MADVAGDRFRGSAPISERLATVDGDEERVFQAPRKGPIRYSNLALRIWKPALHEAGPA